MSVIRQPGVLGRTTQRRVVGVTAALSAAGIETVTVGLWFGLVVDGRTTATALAGLGILFCGSLLRTGVFGATVSELGDLLQPRRLGAALALTAGWVLWLLVAELIEGATGVVVATVVLTALLTVQFLFERYVFRLRSSYQTSFTPILPGAVLAVGAASLLVAVWFVDWAVASPPLALEVTTLVVRIEALQVGIVTFACCSFLAHQYRFQRLLGS